MAGAFEAIIAMKLSRQDATFMLCILKVINSILFWLLIYAICPSVYFFLKSKLKFVFRNQPKYLVGNLNLIMNHARTMDWNQTSLRAAVHCKVINSFSAMSFVQGFISLTPGGAQKVGASWDKNLDTLSAANHGHSVLKFTILAKFT